MLRLPAWGNAWIEYMLDPVTGRWESRPRKPNDVADVVVGFASREPAWGIWKRFYAFYAFEGRLYLRAGRRKWDVTDGLASCKFWAFGFGLMSGLLLRFRDGTSHWPVLIHPGRALSVLVDPTYDGIDAEHDHFFLFLRQQLPSAKWRQGFIDRSMGVTSEAAV